MKVLSIVALGALAYGIYYVASGQAVANAFATAFGLNQAPLPPGTYIPSTGVTIG
jgi:hypothetical protein